MICTAYALVALILGLVLGLTMDTSSSTTPSSVVTVNVGPSSYDPVTGFPIINPARARCAISNATGISLSLVQITSYVGADGTPVSVTAGSSLNAPVSCATLGYASVPARRLAASNMVVTNTTLTASQAVVAFNAPTSSVPAIAQNIVTLANNDPGFVLVNVTVSSASGADSAAPSNAAMPTPSVSATPSTTSSVSVSPTTSSSVTGSPSQAASVTPSRSVTGSRTVTPSAYPTRSPSRSATTSASTTASVSASASPSASASVTASISASATVSVSTSVSATVTPLPPFVGGTYAISNGNPYGPLAYVPYSAATGNDKAMFFIAKDDVSGSTTLVRRNAVESSSVTMKTLSGFSDSYITALAYPSLPTATDDDILYVAACDTSSATAKAKVSKLSSAKSCADNSACSDAALWTDEYYVSNLVCADSPANRIASLAWSTTRHVAPVAGEANLWYTSGSPSAIGYINLQDASAGVTAFPSYSSTSPDRGVGGLATSPLDQGVCYTLNDDSHRELRCIRWVTDALADTLLVNLTSITPADNLLGPLTFSGDGKTAYITYSKKADGAIVSGGVIIASGLDGQVVSTALAANLPPYDEGAVCKPAGIVMVPYQSSTQAALVDMNQGYAMVGPTNTSYLGRSWIGTPMARY